MTRAVHKLDNWKPWVVVAYFALAGTVVWLFFLNAQTSRTQARQARDEAVRIAETEATAQAQRTQCFAAIPTLTRINRFVDGVYELHKTLELNAKALLDATQETDPAHAIREANWHRIRASVAKVSGVHFPVPNRTKCQQIGKPEKGERP